MPSSHPKKFIPLFRFSRQLLGEVVRGAWNKSPQRNVRTSTCCKVVYLLGQRSRPHLWGRHWGQQLLLLQQTGHIAVVANQVRQGGEPPASNVVVPTHGNNPVENALAHTRTHTHTHTHTHKHTHVKTATVTHNLAGRFQASLLNKMN